MTRRGVTLIEVLFGVAVLLVFLAMIWWLMSGAGRQAAFTEETAGLLGTGTLVHDALARDLVQALPIETLPEADRPIGSPLPALRLAVVERYAPEEAKPLRYRVLEYRFDPDTHVLQRDGKPLVREGLTALAFRWLRDGPTVLEVRLSGAALEGRSKDLVLRLPGPPGSDGLPAWVPAPHHRGAEPG